ncbi:MAG: hypothetical protein WBD02_11235 [Acidimicrobiia bacterium]
MTTLAAAPRHGPQEGALMSHGDSKKAIIAALLANLGIAVS